jgi:hypothetical protein
MWHPRLRRRLENRRPWGQTLNEIVTSDRSMCGARRSTRVRRGSFVLTPAAMLFGIIMSLLKSMTKRSGSPYLAAKAQIMLFGIMLTANYIYEMFERRRKALDLSQVDVSIRAFGKADNGAWQSIRRGSIPSVAKVEALAGVLGLRFQLSEAKPDTPSFAREAADKHVTLPWHRATWEADLPPVQLSMTFLQRLGVELERLAVCRVTGGEWEGGEVQFAVVDTVAGRGGGPSLWCFRQGLKVLCRKVQFIGTEVVIFGESARAPVVVQHLEDLSPQLLGRTVWLGVAVPEQVSQPA